MKRHPVWRSRWSGCWLLCLSLCMASACTGTDSQADSGKKAPIAFTYFVNSPGDIVPEHSLIGDYIAERTGVSVQYERVVGEIDQKLGVMIGSKNYPDLIYGGDRTFRLLEANALIPLEDLIREHAPNLFRLYGPHWERMKAADGHIYAIPLSVPTGKPNKWINAAFWVQKKVLKEAGYPTVRTFDQYVELLREYSRKHPLYDGNETIPFEILTYDKRNFTLTTPMQFLAGGPNDSLAMIDPDSYQARFYQLDESITKRYYDKLNDMYIEGLIDREAFVMNYDQYLEKLASGRVLGMFDQSWQILEAQLALKEQGKLEESYVPLPLTFDEDIEEEYMDNTRMNYGFGFSISVNCKDPVRAIEMADYMARDEVQALRFWGFKGENYSVTEQGRFYRTSEQREWLKNKANRIRWSGDIMYFWPGSVGTMPDGNSYDPMQQPEEIEAEYSETDRELLKAYGVRTYEDLFNPPNAKRKYFPAWSIELSESAKEFDQKLKAINERIPPQMVVADTKEEFRKYWGEYVSALSSLDVEGWLDELETKIAERQSKW
ncbi:extracellular solute-binding protein [Cohnella cholangitidis]|uniref:Extracellular solute-binding protein n=1 Tax=Cohnella cholangitidis TaxID=2598458 RepID=A0A7G5C0R2_9BACL|nr:extracellular solute-binding protein [Cohnella cholangitidis]QMV42796.1 extracellular solute-binding protein [Cohnella cholangitidis]